MIVPSDLDIIPDTKIDSNTSTHQLAIDRFFLSVSVTVESVKAACQSTWLNYSLRHSNEKLTTYRFRPYL